MKWTLFKWTDNDILDDEGQIIYKRGWYVLTYGTLAHIDEVVKHEIYIYNHYPASVVEQFKLGEPKFKIEQGLVEDDQPEEESEIDVI